MLSLPSSLTRANDDRLRGAASGLMGSEAGDG